MTSENLYLRGMWLRSLLVGFLCLGSLAGMSTSLDSLARPWSERIQVSGYVKYLQSSLLVGGEFAGVPPALLDQFLGNAVHDHLIHHRMDVRIALSRQWHLQVGWRNRLFYGDQPRLFGLIGEDYGREVDRFANDRIDLSILPLNKRSWVIHSILDRASLEWRGLNDEIRIGRQRVNWGVATLWNPNDLLNAFSFIDFDYEERPGSDALRWTHYFRDFSNLDVAIHPGDSLTGSTLAAVYRGYRKGVNYQILAGFHQGDIAFGGGWEANLGQAAWKVEGTVFLPIQSLEGARDNVVVALTTDWTRSWENGLLMGFGYLLNTGARADAALLADLNERVSARNLYPYRHSIFLQSSYAFTPLFTGALALVYSPVDGHPVFLSPVLSYSLATNWDLDLTGQIVGEDSGRHFVSPLQAFFLRFRWSY